MRSDLFFFKVYNMRFWNSWRILGRLSFNYWCKCGKKLERKVYSHKNSGKGLKRVTKERNICDGVVNLINLGWIIGYVGQCSRTRSSYLKTVLCSVHHSEKNLWRFGQPLARKSYLCPHSSYDRELSKFK